MPNSAGSLLARVEAAGLVGRSAGPAGPTGGKFRSARQMLPDEDNQTGEEQAEEEEFDLGQTCIGLTAAGVAPRGPRCAAPESVLLRTGQADCGGHVVEAHLAFWCGLGRGRCLRLPAQGFLRISQFAQGLLVLLLQELGLLG